MTVIDMPDIPRKKRVAVRFTILAVLGMLGLGGWAGWTYLLQTQPEDSFVVLHADNTPFRVRPATKSQVNVPNQDSTFMSLIDGSSETDRQSEVISLSEPAPEPPPVAVSQAKDETAQIADSGKAISLNKDQQIQPPAEKMVLNSKQLVDKETLNTDIETNDGSGQRSHKLVGSEHLGNKTGDLTAVLNAPESPAPRPKKNNGAQDQMMVQLAAFRKREKAITAAALLNQKHAERLQGYQLGVRLVNSTDGQVFWRVITDPLPKQDALLICDWLKRAGQDCIIRQMKAQKP